MTNHNDKFKVELAIKGMTCASCVSHVEKALLSVPSVASATVNLVTERATIELAEIGALNNAIAAVNQAGYLAQEIRPSSLDDDTEKAKQFSGNETWKVVTAALLSTPLIIPMILEFFGIHVMLPEKFQLILATIVQFGFGARFYRSAWHAIRSRFANMELLVAIGTSAAYGLSVFEMRDQQMGELYFESSAVVITLVMFGKWLEARAKRQTTTALRALEKLRPTHARVFRESQVVEIDLREVKVGDIVIVRPGESVPADGKLCEGASYIDESLISGESLPVQKSQGDRVTGGSMNVDGLIHIEVTAVGSESTLSRIIRMVEDAQVKKAPIQRLVDRVSGFFVPAVLVIAFFTILAWGISTHYWDQAIINGVAVLVIACPCALGLATPTSIMVGTGVAARRGILIRDAEALEHLHSVKAVAFDKTGTLTDGKPKVESVLSFSSSDTEILKIAAGLQFGSSHPLAKAVIELARNRKIVIPRVKDLKNLPGRGLSGSLNSTTYFLGNKTLVTELGVNFVPQIDLAATLESQGHTVSWLVQGDENPRLLGMITFTDSIKPTSKAAVEQLSKIGIQTILLTGDNSGSANKVAQHLGISEVAANILPNEKANAIGALKLRAGIVAMVGDGINDAPALAAADIGIAMASGSDIAINAAGATILRNDPLLISEAIEISRSTYSKIRQNLFWAFIYNIVGIPLAAFGYLSPVIAGAAMALSSFSVVTNSLLLRRWRSKAAQN